MTRKRDTRTAEEREMAELRQAAERADARKNERMTRGDILDAINAALFQTGGNVGCVAEATDRTLQALKDAFE